MKNGISNFEKYLLNKSNIDFEYLYQVNNFVNELNENIINYYKNSIYYLILKDRIEKQYNFKLGDEIFNNYIQKVNNLDGFIIFPEKYLSKIDKEHIYFLMNQALDFINKINYEGVNNKKFIKDSKNKHINNFIRYSMCLSAVKDLNALEQNGLSDFVVETEQKYKQPNYNKIDQIIDTCDNLYNYYDKLSKDDIYNVKKHKISKIKSSIEN